MTSLSKELTTRQQDVVDLVIQHGLGPTAIGEQLGMQASNVSKILSKPHVQQYLHQHISLAMAPAAARAQRRMVGLLDAKSEFVQYQAAQDLLDRAGFKAPERHVVTGDVSISIDLS